MKRLTLIVAVALALVVLAAPVSADSHKIGDTTYGAIEARTGEYAGHEDFCTEEPAQASIP